MQIKATKLTLLALSGAILSSFNAKADIVTDWNIAARDIVVSSKLYTPPANRVMGIVHTAIYSAANGVTQEYPQSSEHLPTPDASLEAAVASASYVSLINLLPQQRAAIEAAYLAATENIPEGEKKQSGIRAGKLAAEAVLAMRADDGADITETYRPHAQAGYYVPTVIPAVPAWPERTPWLLDHAAQFRPGPPPALNSSKWARDLNEVKALGAWDSKLRTAEQTAMALFWEATLPPIYHGVVHSVANQKGRSPTQNARLFAIITQATDDAMISVFDAKYHFGLWRPITAIRNADLDDNEGTKRDPTWKPFIPTPMHPEYPCAHCIVAATVGTILAAEVGDGEMPLLTTSSTTANGVTRSWTSVESFIQEVSDARIYDGVHYRTSADVGAAMGRRVAALAIQRFK